MCPINLQPTFGETVLALETGTYISDLVVANPTHTDGLVQGDGHLRLIKNVLLATLPGLTGPLTATHTALNAAAASYLGIVGEPRLWLADTLPTIGPFGWLNGQAISRTTYPVLFALWGTTYGVGNGSTTFNVPNFQDVVPMGRANMGGATDPGLVGLAGRNVTGTILGEGAHVLTLAELAAHNHGVNDPSHTHGISDPGHGHGANDPGHVHLVREQKLADVGQSATIGGAQPNVGVGPIGTNGSNNGNTDAAATGVTVAAAFSGVTAQASFSGVTTQNNGSGTAHNNVQPSIICNWITLLG